MKNISLLNGENALEKVGNLNPVTYQLNEIRELDSQAHESDTGYVPRKLTDPKLLNRYHMGFLAQDLEKVYPELVYTNEAGIKGINYTGLIPVLVQAFKEQQGQLDQKEHRINTLENQLALLEAEIDTIKAQCCSSLTEEKSNPTGILKVSEAPQAELYQNIPNPFNESTRIEYFLPESTREARLYIYNMQGAQIENFQINTFGEGNLTIQGGSMQPGMYMYTLVADDRVVDTKQMILTK